MLEGTDVLDVSTGTTEARSAIPNHYPILGSELPGDGPGKALPEYRYAVENGAPKLAIVYVAAAAGRAIALRSRNDARAAGMDVVLELEVSPTQFSYASTARAIADSGAQMLLSLLEVNGAVQLAEELTRVDHSLEYPFHRLAYDQSYLDGAGAAAEGTVSFLEFLPFEEAGSNAFLDEFLRYYDEVSGGAEPTFQAISNWVAVHLYAEVVRGLDGPITRDALVEAAANHGEIDGRGLFANFPFATKDRPACKVLVRVVDGRYQREAPASGFYC